MNTLSYTIEQVEIFDGYQEYRDEGFYYVVDGVKLEFSNYNPAKYWMILEGESEDDPFEDKKMIPLNRCICGYWECDSIVATITETENSVLWQVHRLRYEEIISTYEFDKTEYTLVMQEMRKAALEREKVVKNVQTV